MKSCQLKGIYIVATGAPRFEDSGEETASHRETKIAGSPAVGPRPEDTFGWKIAGIITGLKRNGSGGLIELQPTQEGLEITPDE